MGSAAEHGRPAEEAPGRPGTGGREGVRATEDPAVSPRARDFAGGRLRDTEGRSGRRSRGRGRGGPGPQGSAPRRGGPRAPTAVGRALVPPRVEPARCLAGGSAVGARPGLGSRGQVREVCRAPLPPGRGGCGGSVHGGEPARRGGWAGCGLRDCLRCRPGALGLLSRPVAQGRSERQVQLVLHSSPWAPRSSLVRAHRVFPSRQVTHLRRLARAGKQGEPSSRARSAARPGCRQKGSLRRTPR